MSLSLGMILEESLMIAATLGNLGCGRILVSTLGAWEPPSRVRPDWW